MVQRPAPRVRVIGARESATKAVLDVFRRMDVAEAGAPLTTEADVSAVLRSADVGAWLTVSSGAIVAFGALRRLPNRDELRADFAFVPGAVEGAEAMLDRLGAEAAAAQAHSVSLWQVANGVAAPLLSGRGCRRVRTYLRMTLDLRERPRVARPCEVEVIRADDERARRVVHELVEEALAGHWDHVRLDYGAFYAAQAARPGHDPTLWYLGLVDERPAGALVARLTGSAALIALLGTRAQFRGRGVATALLLHAFDELEARGATCVQLDVDSANVTNAARVYERAGMWVELASEQWRLALS